MMAQSQVVALSSRLAAPVPAPKTIDEMNAEEIVEEYDNRCTGDSTREMRDRRTVLGNVVTLFRRGTAVAVGRGRGMVNALADALEHLP